MWIFSAALFVCLAAAVVLGIASLTHVRTTRDFLVAGRRYGGFSIGGSLAATILGASSTLGLAGLSATQGLAGAWWLLVGVPGLLALFFLIPRIKRFPVYTLPELIGEWYGPLVRKVSGVLVAFAWLGIIGAQMGAAGRILALFWPGGVPLWTLAAGAVFVFYTTAGGQVSVIRTDSFQIVLILAGILAAVFGGLQALGGWTGLQARLDPSFFSFPFSASFTPAELLLLLLTVGSTYLVGPDMLSRVFCSRDARAARRGVLMAIATIVPTALIVALIGMEARALLPEALGPGAGGEAAFPGLIRGVLPAPLGALALAALISAFLSSADTTLLTASAIVSVDLFSLAEGAVRPMRLITMLVGIISVAVGILTRGIIPSLLLGYTVFTGGLFIPIAAGLAGRPMRRASALLSMIGGGLLALAGKLLRMDAPVVAAFLFSLALLAVDLLLERSDRPGRRKRPEGAAGCRKRFNWRNWKLTRTGL
jgi:SSS family solute:Na+ symporter